ncbi:hypothetical protein JQ629_05330 [Bradyrhizobium sp. AUGA SZCCT0222]|uniref:hypothetical protein n=1 Tax=Bradyrhizobium sp. AUGA SZCCT0222 TaxID=2807668 RepID=UPI001BAB8F8E|nr:hypothetical protein [Bradyrhizobium sp. AUGA SZCCT0222]MBR1266928.1 hypothetical protein [Bradyrhizobium sp. AUGA SZCCT0222]
MFPQDHQQHLQRMPVTGAVVGSASYLRLYLTVVLVGEDSQLVTDAGDISKPCAARGFCQALQDAISFLARRGQRERYDVAEVAGKTFIGLVTALIHGLDERREPLPQNWMACFQLR